MGLSRDISLNNKSKVSGFSKKSKGTRNKELIKSAGSKDHLLQTAVSKAE